MKRKYGFLSLAIGVSSLIFFPNLMMMGCNPTPTSPGGDATQVLIGERLFKETRFAQFFAAHMGADVNQALATGDSVMDVTLTRTGTLPGPFQGQAMNCAACHLVDQQLDQDDGGMRTYNDFARRSPIPQRTDGRTLTPRNSPPLVNASLAKTLQDNTAFFLHLDGEFATAEDLVRGTLTGRNYGWLATEHDQAIAQIVKVIKEDDGSSALASEFGGWSYAEILRGTNPNISPAFRLPESFRLDVTTASDTQIVNAVASLITAYLDGLQFSQDENGEYNASPYDVFLKKNGLPRKPNTGESDITYSQRLLTQVNALSSPQFLAHSDGQFGTHPQQFLFGATELQGMKIFFGTANCIACHAAPNFTDFKFHNTGVTQREFDNLHGEGSFAALSIPSLATRQASPETYLPPTASHPNGSGQFLSIPSVDDSTATDLGLWNVFANDDITGPQASLRTLLCAEFAEQVSDSCTDDELLPLTIAYFKTPGLRDLSHSAPYMHNGQFDELSDVVDHYRTISDTARANNLRNPSQEISDIHLSEDETAALVQFLKALNEDYE